MSREEIEMSSIAGSVYDVKLTLTSEILGTVPKSKEVYTDYVVGKALKEGVELTEEQVAAELETVQDIEEKGWTGFHMRDGKPVLRAYVIKGFFKEACGMLRRCPGTKSKPLTAHKKVIDGLVFIEPNEIELVLPEGAEMGVCERPLRAYTAQGERVALAKSDTCPVGTTLEFQVKVLGQVTEVLLREWLDYGALRGLGQWRNAAWGCFEYTMEKVEAAK
jgi:hypothetical protein